MMNDYDRKRLVYKDEGLKRAWKESGMSIRQWTQEHRQLIDDVAGSEREESETEHNMEHQGARKHGKW